MNKLPFDPGLFSGMDVDPRGVEKTMWSVNKLLEAQDFESLDEMQGYMDTLVGSVPKYTPKNDAEKAQSAAYDAYQAKTPKKRVRLARKALEISPDCADAYVILAEETATSAEEAKPIYEQGVAAGERALAEMMNDEEVVGLFWDTIDARGYMRARFGLAQALWDGEERPAAVEHARDLLRLDEDDHQGVRYILVNWLIRIGDDSGANQILKRYPEQRTHGRYSRALLAFREKGDVPSARTLLKTAFKTNPVVPAIFIGQEFLDGMFNSLDEIAASAIMMMSMDAMEYLSEACYCWDESPGAIDWMLDLFAKWPGLPVQVRQPPRNSGKSRRSKRR